MRGPNYTSLVRAITALPPKRPRPLPEPARFNVAKFVQRVRDALEKPVAEVAVEMYRFSLVHALGTQTLEDHVPVAQVRQRLAHHVSELMLASVSAGATPVRILYSSDWSAFLDYGEGRVLGLRAQLHNPTAVEEETKSSIVVEEGDLPVPSPWDDDLYANN